MDLDVSLWLLSFWSGVEFDVLTQGIDALVGGEIRLLDLVLDNGSLTVDWGSELEVLPAFDADLWFDVSFGLGDVTVASQTDFALTPFALTQQRFDISLECRQLLGLRVGRILVRIGSICRDRIHLRPAVTRSKGTQTSSLHQAAD